MHTITLCYSHHPSVAPVIKSESTLGISEVFKLVYGLPVSNGFMLPVRITRGYLYWAPSAPRLSESLHSPVSNPETPETGMCMPRMQRLDTTPYHHGRGFYLASAGRSLVLACAARGA